MSNLTVDDFSSCVKRLIDLQERMSDIAQRVKEQRTPLKQEVDDLKERVKTYMEQTSTDVCNYHDYQLKVAKTTQWGSLTRKTLRAALSEYFKDEGRAQECYDAVLETIGSREKTVLRKTRRPKKKGAPAEDNAAGPAGSGLQHDDDEDDEERAPELSDSD